MRYNRRPVRPVKALEDKQKQLAKFLTLQRLEKEKNPKQRRKIERILDELEGGSNDRR